MIQGLPEEPISGHALVAESADLGEGVEIGPFATVGWDGESPVAIGPGTKIFPYVLIEPGAVIGANCVIDAYCRVGAGSMIGNNTRLLYGAAVFESARIGASCIIGGDVADRTVIEDFVTHFGEIAHDYRHPGDAEAWDKIEAKSPRICERAVIGQNAVLVGGITIGAGSVVGAGETVRVNVPPAHLYQNRELKPLSLLKGFVEARTDTGASE